MKKIAIAVLAIGAAVSLAACDGSATNNDQAAVNDQLGTYQSNQPIPKNTWSQFRQTVIDVEQAQVHGMATTTFFYNLGIAKPDSCPSLGFPVPSTAQLTNPEQIDWNSNRSGVIAQAEPNGVYTGGSTGTYVVCVAPDGQKYIQYWEGDVKTIGGPAHWDSTTQTVVLDGAPTVKVNTK